MKKIIYSVFVALFIVLNSCSDKQEFVDIYYNGVDPRFGETEIKTGQVLAESLRETVKKIKKDKIDLSNSNYVEKVSLEMTLDVIEKKYAITEEEMMKVKEVATLYNREDQYLAKSSTKSDNSSLTIMQQRALNAIEYARVNSKSAIAFMDKLAAINQRVDDLVPEGERELLHRIIANNYYEIKEINNLVRAGYLPGKAEARPKRVKTGTELAFNDVDLLGLTKVAHAGGEVTVLPEIVIVVPSSNIGNGISWSDWYQIQDTYGNGYRDGYGDGYEDGSSTEGADEDDDESWWSSWGQCAAATLGGAGTGALAGWWLPAAGCTVVVPGIGTVACGAVGAIVGGISGALTALGTANAC